MACRLGRLQILQSAAEVGIRDRIVSFQVTVVGRFGLIDRSGTGWFGLVQFALEAASAASVCRAACW